MIMTKQETKKSLLLISAMLENISSLQETNREQDDIIRLSEAIDNHLIDEGLVSIENISSAVTDLRDTASDILNGGLSVIKENNDLKQKLYDVTCIADRIRCEVCAGEQLLDPILENANKIVDISDLEDEFMKNVV